MFLGCVLKDLFVLSLHCCVLPQGFPCSLTKLFTLCSYGKTFSDFSFLVFLNIQLSVSFLFLYSVFNERLLSRNSRSVVGPSGLEPPTSCLSGTRSNLLSYEPVSYGTAFTRFGGDDGIRTHDPLLAGQVLSQLSYTPIGSNRSRLSCPHQEEKRSLFSLPVRCQHRAIFPYSRP